MSIRAVGPAFQRSLRHARAPLATERFCFPSALCSRRWTLVGDAQPVVAGGLLRDAALMLGVALVFVTAFRRLGLGATLGYVVAGVLIGPSVLGLFREPEVIQRVSEIGIALLLFIVGLELQ